MVQVAAFQSRFPELNFMRAVGLCDEYQDHLVKVMRDEYPALNLKTLNLMNTQAFLDAYASKVNSSEYGSERSLQKFLQPGYYLSPLNAEQKAGLEKLMKKYAAISEIKAALSDKTGTKSFQAAIEKHAALLAESRTTSPFIKAMKEILNALTLGFLKGSIHATTGSKTLNKINTSIYAGSASFFAPKNFPLTHEAAPQAEKHMKKTK